MAQTTSNYILETSREFSIYTCEHRAIPKWDGFKDSQRKVLWLIKDKSEKIKTVSLAGEMISSGLYLHGDASAAGAISMLAAPYCNNVPLIEGVGAFGTRVSPVEGIGAPRYTYVKKNKLTNELVFSDLDVVPLKENYDGSTVEPVSFLPLIPLVLLNGVSGLAVGWSTEILRRKFSDLVDATIAALDGKKVKQLIPHYSLFDVKVNHLQDNVWEFTGKVKILDSSTIHITELPPDLTLEKFKQRLNALEDNGTINTYVDRSTKTIDITVKYARGTLKDKTEEDIISQLKLKQRATERLVILNPEGTSIIQYETAEKLVEDFVVWRLGYYTVRYQKKKDDDSYELIFWKGVKACFDKNLPARLPKKLNRDDIKSDIHDITKTIGLDDDQLNKIVNLPTYRWAKDAYQNVIDMIAKLEQNIRDYNAILSDPNALKQLYKTELQDLKKLVK